MTQLRRLGSMLWVLAPMTLVVILLSDSAFATHTDERRKIVRFRPVTPGLSCWLGQCLNLSTSQGLARAISEVTGGLTGYAGKVVRQLPLINALAVVLPDDNLLDTVTNLVNSLYVLDVLDDVLTHVDPICPTTVLPLTESYPWGQKQITVPAVHPEWQGSGVTVAILDTGIANHCEFADDLLCLHSRLASGYNALTENGSATDDHGHGTHMAGIIGANLSGSLQGSVGVIGVAPQATLVPVKVLDHHGTGYLSDVINGLQWVSNNDIGLVNMSFGFPIDSPALRLAIESLSDKGVIMVASAGNSCAAATITEDGGGDDCGTVASCSPLTAITYPAAYEGVLAVGATNIRGEIPAYSLSGPQLAVVAPGGELESGAQDDGQILSTNLGLTLNTGLVEYGRGHGTSQAAAHVTGAVALVLQLQPELSFMGITELLNKTAVDLKYPKEQQGAGRIDVQKMIEELLP